MRHPTSPSLEELPAPGNRRGWPWSGADRGPAPDPGGEAWPRITLVTPSFNQVAFLEATLRSVLLQGYPELEYIVMDGGSTDGSVDVLRRYAPFLTAWSSEADAGQADAIDKGLLRATGEVVGWLNSDDRLLPGALFSVARLVRDRPDAVAWLGCCRSVDAAGRLVYVQEPRGLTREGLADWGRTGQIAQPACFFSRAAAARGGFLDRALHYALDVDLWLRLAGLGTFAASPETWAEETLHPAAKTSAQRGRSLAELHYVQLRHGFQAIALEQLARELQELETFRRGTWIERTKLRASMALQPLLWRLRRR